MEQKLTNLGSSLPVPCVQELAEDPLTMVPPRYVRVDQDPPVVSNTSSLPQVPVIDMQSLLSKDLIVMDTELEKLHHACKHWGFFQLINHGVSNSLIENVKSGIQEFFNLPIEEKKMFRQHSGDVEGFGQIFVVSEEQKLDWVDLFYLTTLPAHLRKPHLFPKLPLPFRDTLEAYSCDLKALAMKILDLMAKALKMEATDMKALFDEGFQSMRMNYYPPCPQPELVIGLNPHSDAIDGMWIPVKPLHNAFVVNIGDILEVPTVNSEKERLSIAIFYNPKLDGDMGSAPSLVTPETPTLFKRIRVADYFKGYLSRELQGKSYLDVMRIQNEEEKGI
ncbi:protein SRG1-like [Fagus crenata]